MVLCLTVSGGSLTRPRQPSSGPEPEALLALSVGGEGRLSCVLRAPPARPAAPVVQQPLAFAACSTLHARTRVHASLTRARCPIVCTHLSRRPSAAPPGLQALLYQSLQQSPFFSRLIAFESVPPAAPTALPAHHPSRAGPAAAVWRPALAAPGGRHWALVSWGRPRSVARGRQGGGAPAVAKAVPAPQSPPRRPGRLRPGRACRSRQGWPAAGWAPPGTPWQGLRQAGSVGRVGRPQAWAPAGAGWQGVGGRGRVGLREKWLYFSYTRQRPGHWPRLLLAAAAACGVCRPVRIGHCPRVTTES